MPHPAPPVAICPWSAPLLKNTLEVGQQWTIFISKRSENESQYRQEASSSSRYLLTPLKPDTYLKQLKNWNYTQRHLLDTFITCYNDVRTLWNGTREIRSTPCIVDTLVTCLCNFKHISAVYKGSVTIWNCENYVISPPPMQNDLPFNKKCKWDFSKKPHLELCP